MVDVIGRLAQRKVEDLATLVGQISYPFNINGCNWRLSVERVPFARTRLSLEPSENQPLFFARFVLRIIDANHKPYTSPIYEEVLQTNDAGTCSVEVNFKTPFVVRIEFLDLRIRSPHSGLGSSIVPCVNKVQQLATRSSSRNLSHMLNESVHADITIVTSDGELQAHRAILSTSSPVFRSMFVHELKENVSSTIEIKDMTSESCTTLLRFLYGGVQHEEFWKHRLELLAAANKYDIRDLKDACVESLLEDIDADNVLDRLQEGWLYKLENLMRGCFRYLLDFGQIHHVSKEKKHDFLLKADRVLIVLMFNMMTAKL